MILKKNYHSPVGLGVDMRARGRRSLCFLFLSSLLPLFLLLCLFPLLLSLGANQLIEYEHWGQKDGRLMEGRKVIGGKGGQPFTNQ